MTSFNPEVRRKPPFSHPSRIEESPFPETPEELAEAKQLAGVTTREDSRARFLISELVEEPEDVAGQKIQELASHGTPGLRTLLSLEGLVEKTSPLFSLVEKTVIESKIKLRQELFPKIPEGVRYTNQVRQELAHKKQRSYVFDAMLRLDQLMGYPPRKRPGEPSRGMLFFEYLPSHTTLALDKSVYETLSIRNEKERIAQIFSDLEIELATIASSEVLSSLTDPKDRTFITELAAAVANPPEGDVLNIIRPPLNKASLDRCLRIIAALDSFPDLNDYKMVPKSLEASPAQILAAVYVRERVLPQERTYFQLLLKRAASLSDVYTSTVQPISTRITPLSVVHNIYKDIITSGQQTAENMAELNEALNKYGAHGLHDYNLSELVAFKEKHDQVVAEREAERLVSMKESPEDAREIEIPRGQKGIPEITRVDRRTIKKVRTSAQPNEKEIHKTLEPALEQFSRQVGKKYAELYRIDQLTPGEFMMLGDLIKQPNSEQVQKFVKDLAEEALGILLSTKKTTRSFTPREIGLLQAYADDPKSVDLQLVGATLIKFFGLPWENRYLRNQNLPEPFEGLPVSTILTELFLREVVEKHRGPEEGEVAFKNIQNFLQFDKQVVQKKFNQAQLKTTKIPFVRAKLLDLKAWYERNHSFSRRQRKFVQGLCSEYHREVEPLLT